MNKCSVCNGETVEKTITYTQWYEGRFVAVENVKADVCETCGEEYFTPSMVNKIQEAIESNSISKTIELPVFQLK